jgi:S-adenosylmethionine-dependent methyltransferase
LSAKADSQAKGERATAEKAFGEHAKEWDDYTRSPLGRLRERLVLHHLGQELQRRARRGKVLDAGGGTGGYAMALAQQGYDVCLLDFAPEMLELARQRLVSEDPAAAKRIDSCCLPVEDLPERFPTGHFDVVLCHTLLEYLEQPLRALGHLVEVLKLGGLISLLLANPPSAVLVSVWGKKDPKRALQALRGELNHTDLFGLPRHAVAFESVCRQLQQSDMQVVAEYGLRIFADYLPRDLLADPQLMEQVWQLELAASELSPYADIARYKHVLAVRR